MSLGRLMLYLFGGIFALVLLGMAVDRLVLPAIIHRQGEVLSPEIVGLDEESARREAGRLGLELEVSRREYDAASPVGTVLRQFPEPFRPLRRGRPLRVVLSQGLRKGQVPDLRGLSLRQAELLLAREGLSLGRVAQSLDPAGQPGVAAQRPRPGRELSSGGVVDLVLRRGPERSWHLVPDFRGRPISEVRALLQDAGFELRQVRHRPDDEHWPGTIIDQDPPAGARIPLGGSLELVAASRS